MQLITIRRRYSYPRLERIDAPEGRVYQVEDLKLPSITSILSKTKDRAFLDEWVARVGKEEAERIRNDAATVGTHMHNVIDRLLMNRDLPTPRTWLAIKGYWMGYKLIETFFHNVHEAWGTEIPLYYPGRFAGTSDFIGVYKDAASIVDYKQSNKMKRREWIEDYFLQLAAYATAHNELFGTTINQGVILMITPEGETKEFLTCGREFEDYKDKWMRRVEAFEKLVSIPSVS